MQNLGWQNKNGFKTGLQVQQNHRQSHIDSFRFVRMKVAGMWGLFLLLVTAPVIKLKGQSKIQDSLYQQLRHEMPDTSRVQLYIALGKQYINQHPDSALLYLNKAANLAQTIGYIKGIIRAYANQTDVLNRQLAFDQALQLNRKSLALAKKHRLKQQIANSYQNLGISYSYKGEYETSLDYYLKSLSIYEGLQSKPSLQITYSNLCALYTINIRDYSKAIYYGEKALQLAHESQDNTAIASARLNMGAALMHLKKYSEAKVSFQEAYVRSKEASNTYVQSIALLSLGDVQLQTRHYAEAIPFFDQMLQLTQQTPNIASQAMAFRGLAVCHLNTKQLHKAQQYARQSVELCRKHSLLEIWDHSAFIWSDIELALGNLKGYNDLWQEGDSIQNLTLTEKSQQNLRELEAKYETGKKIALIGQLQKEKQIQQLSLKQKNTLNYVFSGALISLLSVGLLFYKTTRNQKIITRQTQTLQQQRIRELEQSQQLLAANSMIQGQEVERRRLAQDLHDGLGGMLSGIKLSLSDMKGNLILSEENAARFSVSLEQLDNTIRELRRVAHSLMPEALVRFGLTRALQDFCNELGRAAQLHIDLQIIGIDTRLHSDIEITIYRIVQELLNNVVRHANATTVLVQIAQTDELLSLTIEDNGQGFAPEQISEGIGLANIRSRVDYLKGTLDIQTAPGAGTAINIDFFIDSSATE